MEYECSKCLQLNWVIIKECDKNVHTFKNENEMILNQTQQNCKSDIGTLFVESELVLPYKFAMVTKLAKENLDSIIRILLLIICDVFRSKTALICLMLDSVRTNPSSAKNLRPLLAQMEMKRKPEENGTILLSSYCLVSALLLGLATFGDFLTFAIEMAVVRKINLIR